jgi:ribosomal-protein-alanine N-acetyltransferase
MMLAGANKAELLAAIHASAFSSPWDAKSLADLMASPGVFAMSNDAHGFILIRVVEDEAEVLTLAVTPLARRKGLGRRLTNSAELLAAQKGAADLFLEVAADNSAAIALYESAGFRQAGLRAGYYPRPAGGTVDALILKKRLTPPA